MAGVKKDPPVQAEGKALAGDPALGVLAAVLWSRKECSTETETNFTLLLCLPGFVIPFPLFLGRSKRKNVPLNGRMKENQANKSERPCLFLVLSVNRARPCREPLSLRFPPRFQPNPATPSCGKNRVSQQPLAAGMKSLQPGLSSPVPCHCVAETREQSSQLNKVQRGLMVALLRPMLLGSSDLFSACCCAFSPLRLWAGVGARDGFCVSARPMLLS
ncbi:unnamed protein product [Pleuronectes platessa]|uniref:Uncharacterized protein n=1 Tax=Pleuronectes platessa TaxID=8262 RepID=A0A9N7U3Y4_PLEPL|nr:unnamed protein product [Pleuronectes platessa]